MPHLQTLVKRHQDDPFVLIGINHNDGEKAYREGLEAFDVTWLSAYQGRIGNVEILERYHVQGFPTYVLIDAEGKLVGMGHQGKAFDARIAELIAKLKQEEEEGEAR